LKRILIAGGGTGGHFYPGLSLATYLKKRGWQVVFAVKKNDICLQSLSQAEIPSVEIDMVSFPRGLNPFSYLKFIFKLLKSISYCLRIIKDFSPLATIGMGSYVAFPVILAAKIKKKKTYVHESNAVMGLSNHLSAFFSDKIFLGLPVRENNFSHKTLLTGTPLRESFLREETKEEARKKLNLPLDSFIILVFGGSQGAVNINEAFYKLLLELDLEKKKPSFIHLAGKNNYESLKEKYEKAQLLKDSLILPYFEDMPLLYCASDLIISRSGSGTICELMRYKKPAILIPLKNAAGDHQTFNALELSRHGGALILKDDEHLSRNLRKSIESILNGDNLSAMKKAYERIEIPIGEKPAVVITEEIEKDTISKKL